MMPDNTGDFREVATRTVSAIIVWSIAGVGVATAISFFVLGPFALLFVPRYSLMPAVILGALHCGWLTLEKNNWSDRRDADSFALLSGLFVGLLGFAPAFVRVTEATFSWSGIAILVSAAALGGSVAGLIALRKLLPSRMSAPRRNLVLRVLRGALIVLPVGTLEAYAFRSQLAEKLPPSILWERDVVGLSSGNAKGSMRSGEFQYSGRPTSGSGMRGNNGGLALFVQNDGRLLIKNIVSSDLVGGIDSDGQFWAGAAKSDTMLLRTRIDGKFVDSDRFTYTEHSSLFSNGAFPKHINSTLDRGTGTRWKSLK